MTVLFLPFAALLKDEATAKVCRQISRLLGADIERAGAHGFQSRFLSSRGTTAEGVAGLVASLELPSAGDLETTTRMYGADLVVVGTFGLGERNLVLEARIFDARVGKEVYAKRFETYPSYYFDAIEEVKVRIVQLLKLDLSEAERVELLRRPTESWQALLYYMLAEDDRYALTLGIGGGDIRPTLDLYREALTIDPDFGAARDAMKHVVLLMLDRPAIDLSELASIVNEYDAELGIEFTGAMREFL